MLHDVRRIRLGLLTLACLWTATSTLMARVVINEIHYHPDVKTERAEFVELYNSGSSAVDLSGWRISGGVDYVIPNGTSIGVGAYLVIAQDPATILSKFGASALGPWAGRLSNEGGAVQVVNPSGGIEDEVNYQLGFPWPTVGNPPGYSIELANPNFDNDLGGNWRASYTGIVASGTRTLIAAQSSWRYYKGLSEASSPTTAWRALGFDDSAWSEGTAPIGYDPTVALGTILSDMRYNYTTVFFRKIFVVTNVVEISGLLMELLYDDGVKLWINGNPVRDGDFNVAAGEMPYTATAGPAREDGTYNQYTLDGAQSFLLPGTNVIAIQAANTSIGNSSDFFLDLRLLAQIGPASHGPTPGALNSVFTTNLPPQIRQVDHSPKQPGSGQAVTITAKVTDPEGVSGVTLHYQLVDPGSYIELADPAYTTNWISVPMNDAGINGDAQAGDSVFTALLPASLQTHRRLVRYRITAQDATGLAVTVPYADDPQPNFGYFCYDGVPAWQAAVRPGVTPALNFDTNVMRRLPVVHLISKKSVVEDATWFSRYAGDLYLWAGTVVFDGKVYDHVHFRARGGVWRYAMTKNMWKFDFNSGHPLEMQDDYGHKYNTTWTKLNLGSCIQQGDFGHRGEQGMFESVGFRLFNLAGVAACKTTYLQFRVIDDVQEAPAGSQYEGDFWGLYLAVEQEDGRFLDQHGLPDGNFYKMEGGSGVPNNLGPLGPADQSDLNAFLNTYRSTSPSPDETWWRANLSLSNYWSYQTVVQGIHHYDICYGKNYFYYRNPESGLWSVHSWDLDLTWANNMYDSGCGGIDDLYYPVFGGNGHPAMPALTIEYRNRVREIRELLFNADQAWQVISECATLLRGTTNNPTFLDADRCQWDYNPKMASSTYSDSTGKSGQGRYYQWPYESTVSKTFDGCVQLMKNYIVARGSILDSLANDPAIPAQPSLTYVGAANYALNRLTFQSSAYSGANPFAAMKWRIGEVTDTNAPAFDPAEKGHYEITSDWESGELPTFNNEMTLPPGAAKVGHSYRVRVRMKDTTGRWSRWSPPVQFIAGLPENAAALAANLRVSELMYDPVGGSDYEFIELRNASETLSLDLEGATFTAGIDFTFGPGLSLPPGGYLLVVGTTNHSDFRAHYGLSVSVPLVGPYAGSLANGGEQLTLKAGAGGTEIFSFEFGNGRGWPLAAQGAGHSLVPLDSAAGGQATGALDYPGNWRGSSYIGGSPGAADPLVPAATVVLNEITAHTDYNDPLHPEYDSNDWIELYNTTGTNVTLTGWYLSDDPADPRKWAIPTAVVPARGWVVFDEVTGFHWPITSGFGLDKAGEQVLLSHLTGTAQDRVVDAVQFKGQENGASIGRYPDGAEFCYPMARTPDGANGAARTSLIVNEIMYHPPGVGSNENVLDEYIELWNPTSTTIALQDTNGLWRINGGVSFDFPPNTTVAPGGTLLVVNFNPADGVALAVFRAAYGITNTQVPILGPYSGKLGNRSDRVAVEKPQYPDLVGYPYSWIIVDEAIYGNQAPWPANANGGGYSLCRLSSSGNGNDPTKWGSGVPSPGQVASNPLDQDGDGMPDAWELQFGLNPHDSSDAAWDADNDGMSNLAEYLSGTNPADPTSSLRFDQVTSNGSTLTLRFTAQPGHSYTVQFRNNAGSGLWQKLADEPAGPTLRPVDVPDPDSAIYSPRFYRLVTPSMP